jgi:hypothetical protein
MRGLDIAEETCLTINEMGMMAIQHQVLDQEGQANFVDFLMASLEDDEEVFQQDQEEALEGLLSLGWKTTQECQEGSDSEHEEPPISATPLFGTVVAAATADTVASATTARRKRRRSSSRNAPGSDSEEEEEAPGTPQRGNGAREHQVSSSPELVYGEEG